MPSPGPPEREAGKQDAEHANHKSSDCHASTAAVGPDMTPSYRFFVNSPSGVGTLPCTVWRTARIPGE